MLLPTSGCGVGVSVGRGVGVAIGVALGAATITGGAPAIVRSCGVGVGGVPGRVGGAHGEPYAPAANPS